MTESYIAHCTSILDSDDNELGPGELHVRATDDGTPVLYRVDADGDGNDVIIPAARFKLCILG